MAKQSLAADMKGARAVVSWSSNVLNEAILAGYPSFRLAPYHVNDAILDNLDDILDPPQKDREAAFGRLAWAQWDLKDIASGTAFKHLLQDQPR